MDQYLKEEITIIPDELKKMKPMTGSERLGANRSSEYLGAEDIDPGVEPVLTIEALYNGMITLQRGKENKDVIVFKEDRVPGIRNVRPLVCNATNRKTLRKLYKSVTADNLVGKKVQLYVDHSVRDPSTGEMTDGIRIRNKKPVEAAKAAQIICEKCGKPITAIGQYSAEDIVRINEQRFGKKLCGKCSKEMSVESVSGQQKEQPAPEAEAKEEQEEVEA
jgi:hypothetical protein